MISNLPLSLKTLLSVEFKDKFYSGHGCPSLFSALEAQKLYVFILN